MTDSKQKYNQSIIINNKTIESSKSVKLLGEKIGLINNICKVANKKIKSLRRIRSRLNLAQVKILYNAFILS